MDADYAARQKSLEGPAWRSKLVGQFPGRRSHRRVQAGDEHLRRLHHYRQLCSNGPAGLRQAIALYPMIARAEALHESDKVDLLKVAVLGGLEGREIAERLRLDAGVIDVWEKIYFDVREMREAVGWIHVQVIEPERAAGRENLVARLKFATAVGPVGARAVLDLDTRIPLNEGQRLFDRRLKLHLKCDAAAEMTIETNREKMFFIRTYVHQQVEQDRLQLRERELSQRCQESLDKYEHAKIRRELVQERAERREAARERREREQQLIREAKATLWHQEVARCTARLTAEANAAAARAQASPLAELKWHKGTAEMAAPSPSIVERKATNILLPVVSQDASLPLGVKACGDILADDNTVTSTEPVAVPA
jgi:hypothetical protein